MKWWENLCRKCGVCCLKKKLVNDTWIIDYNSPCEYLDIESNQCFVYEKRFKFCRECRKMNLFRALFCDFLPDDCGYVVNIRKLGIFKNIGKK